MNKHREDFEHEKCEECGNEAELLSIHTMKGWTRICAQCYMQILVKEPVYDPPRHRKVNLFRLPDFRKIKDFFKRIKTPICGMRKGCDVKTEECSVYCARQFEHTGEYTKDVERR